MPDVQSVGFSGTVSAVVSILTFLVGFGSKWLLELEQHRRLTTREREARRDARRDSLLQRQSDFQRQNLIDLQETCSRLIRSAGQANHHDVVTFRKTGEWQKALLPEGVSDEFRSRQSTATLLCVRVRDAEIRRLTEEFQNVGTFVVKSTDPTESDRALQEMVEVYKGLNQRIGVALRELEDAEIQHSTDQR